MDRRSRSSAWVRRVRREWTATAHAWERWEPQLVASLAPVDPHLFRALDLRPGQRVLDFGCGSGEPTLSLAPLLAPGEVIGIDISAPMLATARRRARMRGAANVRFLRGDIARMRLPGRFDGVVSRYGLMFVDDVPLTLERLRRVMKPGGRIAIAVWGPLEKNPFMRARMEAVRPFLAAPPPDPETFPSPLRLARPGLLGRHLRKAGFENVRVREAQVPLVYAGREEYFEYSFQVPGPMMDLYGTLTRRQRETLRRRMMRALAPYVDGSLVRLPAVAWVGSGRKAGRKPS